LAERGDSLPLSAVDCFQPALQHTRDQLLRPFRFGQWSRLALVGLLAAEMQMSSCNPGSFKFPASAHRNSHGLSATPFPHFDPSHLDPARIVEFVGVVLTIVVLVFILGFIFLYISSVFRFILFDSVLRKRCAISEGWQRWHRAGRRYFLWQIVFAIAQSLFLGVLIAVPLAIAVAFGWFRNIGQHVGRTVLLAVALIGLFVVFALVAAVIKVLAKDFLVPIMALEDLDFADGWSRLVGMIRPEPGRYVVYLLLKIVLAIASAILFGILALIPVLILVVPAVMAVVAGKVAGLGWNVTTVSMAIVLGSLLMIVLIYVVALINVPATVFFPAFSIYFFAARYPRLDALLNPPPPVVDLPPAPASPPPYEPPPLPPSPEPIG
jgi:hypothetical protein